MIDVVTPYGTYQNCRVQLDTYQADGSVCIGLWNDEDGPIARLTVCLSDNTLEDMESYVDLNNCPWALNLINRYKLGEQTGKIGFSGYCSYPVVHFDRDTLEKHM